MTPITSHLPPADPLAVLAGDFIETDQTAFNPIGRDRTNDKLIRTAKQSNHHSLANQLQEDRDRISRCSISDPCTLLACPRCSAGTRRATCDAAYDASIEHLREDKRNGLIVVRLSAKGDQWDVYPSQVVSTVTSFVLPYLVPALSKFKQVAGAHVCLDIAPTNDTVARLSSVAIGHADSLQILDNAPVHVHFHLVIATKNVKQQESKELMRRIVTYVQDHHAGVLQLETDTRCIENKRSTTSATANPNPMRPEYLPLRTCIQYNNKLQSGVKRAPHAATMTRVLRSHLVGHPIHWNTGVYLSSEHPTAKTRSDIRRLTRLSDYMQSFESAAKLQIGYRPACGHAVSVHHELGQWSKTLSDRLTLDEAYLRRHGRLELETRWSDTTGYDELSGTSKRYLSQLTLLQSKQLVHRRRTIWQIKKWLLCILRLFRKSIPLETSEMDAGVRRYLELLRCVDRARRQVCKLYEESPNSVALIEMIDSLKAGNDVFPTWTPDDRPQKVNVRVWLTLVADMLFAASPVHDDLDDRVMNLAAWQGEEPGGAVDRPIDPPETTSRLTWHQLPSNVKENCLNIPQLERYYSGLHPFEVPVDIRIPEHFLTRGSSTYLRDWQLNMVAKMRQHQRVQCWYPVGSGKKWLVGHLPAMLPKASILIVTRHQMDAEAIYHQNAIVEGRDAGLVGDFLFSHRDVRVVVCHSRKLLRLNCTEFNVVVTLSSPSYSEESREALTDIRCDHWYEFSRPSESNAFELPGPLVSSAMAWSRAQSDAVKTQIPTVSSLVHDLLEPTKDPGALMFD